MHIVIDIPEGVYNALTHAEFDAKLVAEEMRKAIAKGTPLPKGHGKLVDISKIEKDKIEQDNPIIELTKDGNYIEAISLDYLNSLPTSIEADAESEVRDV